MKRIRLSITLDKDLIKLLDEQIDGVKIRNRSHAIEYLLLEALGSHVKKAVILAGGKGVKVPFSDYKIPKCLLPVRGHPLLEHTVKLLKNYGFEDLVISIGSFGQKIRNYFGDGSKLGVKISYVEQGSVPLGTGGAIKVARAALNKNPFLVIYGDVLVNINLKEFIEFHQSQRKTATLALTSWGDTSLWGVAQLRGRDILDFSEKPQHGSSSHLINTGIYIFEPDIFSWFPKRQRFSLEKDVFPRLAKQKELAGWVFHSQWFDIGAPENFKRALQEARTKEQHQRHF